jgi:hypothetical protein
LIHHEGKRTAEDSVELFGDVEVIQRVVYGDPKEVMQLVGADSGGKINTA